MVGIGGALGAMARCGLMLLLPRQLGELPLATLPGGFACFYLGLVAARAALSSSS